LHALFDDLRARAFADYLTPLVLLSLHTGMRRGEVCRIVWADLDDLKEMMFRLRRVSKGVRKGYWQRLLIPGFLIALIVPSCADDKSKDEKPLR
jgi:integrase